MKSVSLLLLCVMTSFMAGCASTMDVESSTDATSSVDLEDPILHVDDLVPLPPPGAAGRVYAEFKGIPRYTEELRSRLKAHGYVIADGPDGAETVLRLHADLSADGKFAKIGRINMSLVDIATLQPMDTAAGSKSNASALSQVGRDVGVNYQLGSVVHGAAGNLGVQALAYGLLDATGLTKWLAAENTYSFCAHYSQDCKVKRDALDATHQSLVLWVELSAHREAKNGLVRAEYGGHTLAPDMLAYAAMQSAYQGLGLGD
jgi:hypothetical protein